MTDRHEPLRVALIADLAEERWPSMDLVADMLHREFQSAEYAGAIEVTLLRPRLARLDPSSRWRRTRTAERFINRFWDYPRWLRAHAHAFDVFHVLDHSYAHVAHELPLGKTVVTCHDIDAFLPLLHPEQMASSLPRFLTRRVMTGMQRAAAISCDTEATRVDLTREQLVESGRLTVIHNGVHPTYSATPDPHAAARIERLLGAPGDDVVDLLHVGTCIPRKRIDVLLRVFAAVREHEPRTRLVKAGGQFTTEQRALVDALGVSAHIVQMPFLSTEELACVYRRAAMVLMPSEREGFGLPIIESLACGTPVLASDLAVAREVGGTVVRYLPVGDVQQWRDAALAVVKDREDAGARERYRDESVRQARRFSWTEAARLFAGVYRIIHASTMTSANPTDRAVAVASIR